MYDLIRRQDAIDAIYKESKLANSEVADEYAEMFVYALKTLPSEEPVTYCKDCWLADLCDWRRAGAEYCSYAERKK